MPSVKKTAKSLKRKQPASLRERARSASAPKKQRRLKSASQKLASPVRRAARAGRLEFYLPMPDNRVGRFLNKPRRLIPRYFREAWAELRLVIWPGRRETAKLTLAVFLFAAFFMVFITAADFVLDRVFKQLILN